MGREGDKKRPGVVWIFSFVFVMGMLLNVGTVVLVVSFVSIDELSLTEVFVLALGAVLLIIDAFFIYYFFTLKEKARVWVHISFASSLVVTLISDVVSIWSSGEFGLSFSSYALGGLFWWIIYDYISKKKVDGELLYG